MQMDMHSAGDEMEVAVNKMDSVRIRRINSKTENSPDMYEIKTSKPIHQWRKVSFDNGNVGMHLLRH